MINQKEMLISSRSDDQEMVAVIYLFFFSSATYQEVRSIVDQKHDAETFIESSTRRNIEGRDRVWREREREREKDRLELSDISLSSARVRNWTEQREAK